MIRDATEDIKLNYKELALAEATVLLADGSRYVCVSVRVFM